MADADPKPPPALDGGWTLEPGVQYLNHGSFGACPAPVLAAQRALVDHLEREPVRFMVERLEPLLIEAIERLAAFVGAPAPDVVPVANATEGVNAVLRSLDLRPGDELIVTDHEYNACRNVLEFVAAGAGARVVVAPIPFPLSSTDQAANAVMDRVTPRTRLALLDHVTSQTALVLPIARLVRELAGHGVETLVDGAHAPGMLALDIAGAIGPAYYTGNCHKWIGAPKSAGFLYVRPDLQDRVRPAVISHGANSTRTDRSRLWLEFSWMGTRDPTPFLAVPAALDHLGGLLPGGWPELMAANHALALHARDTVCAALGAPPPAPDGMLGSMASIPLPDKPRPNGPTSYHDDLQDRLIERGVQVPIIPWPASPKRLLRVSAQLYNTPDQYDALAEALREALRAEAGCG